MSKFIPLFDRIVVKRDDAQDKTKGGLYLPEQAKEKPQQGKAIAVGEGLWNRDGTDRMPMDVEVGDVVLFGPYAGSKVTVGEEELLVLNQPDILGVIR